MPQDRSHFSALEVLFLHFPYLKETKTLLWTPHPRALGLFSLMRQRALEKVAFPQSHVLEWTVTAEVSLRGSDQRLPGFTPVQGPAWVLGKIEGESCPSRLAGPSQRCFRPWRAAFEYKEA